MPPERVADLASPPVVGETYLVECLVVPPARARLIGLDAIPVLGPTHADPSFAPLLGDHRHYDPRFLDESIVRHRIDGLTQAQVALVIAHRVLPGDTFDERPMVCLREMPPWPTGAAGAEAAPWVVDLAAAHRGCRVLADGRCSHAGTDGRSLPRDASGVWTCIHGLRWGVDGTLV